MSASYIRLSLSCLCCVFFFKQKTAYEMRISDWSSDVCSSDLHGARSEPLLLGPVDRCRVQQSRSGTVWRPGGCGTVRLSAGPHQPGQPGLGRQAACEHRDTGAWGPDRWLSARPCRAVPGRGSSGGSGPVRRSEEHTSELQTLMRT